MRDVFDLMLWLFIKLKAKLYKSIVVSRMIFKEEISFYPNTVLKFEREFSKYIGTKHAATFSNGTTAIEAALYALKLSENDEVISPLYTIPSTFSPIKNTGSKIVFADVNIKSLNIDSKDILKKITDNTKAIIVVHIFGNPCDMNEIMSIAEKYNLSVIEDCSHAHGSKIGSKMVGSFGDIGVFSLQGSKAVAAGEGGVIVTDNEILLDRMLEYGHQGRRICGTLSEPIKIENHLAHGLGRKSRAHPIGVGMALVDLRFLELKNNLLYRNWKFINDVVNKYEWIEVQYRYKASKINGFFGGSALILNNIFKSSRDEVIHLMNKNNISSYAVYQHNNDKNPVYKSVSPKGRMLNDGSLSKEFKSSSLEGTKVATERVIMIPLIQFFLPSKKNKFIKVMVEINQIQNSYENY